MKKVNTEGFSSNLFSAVHGTHNKLSSTDGNYPLSMLPIIQSFLTVVDYAVVLRHKDQMKISYPTTKILLVSGHISSADQHTL